MEFIIPIVTAAVALISSLATLFVQAYLTKKQVYRQTLFQTKITTYARLVSATKSESRYPDGFRHINPLMQEKEADEYNDRIIRWRENRRIIKGIASEALILTENSELRKKLNEFILNDNPELRLSNIDELIRFEINEHK